MGRAIIAKTGTANVFDNIDEEKFQLKVGGGFLVTTLIATLIWVRTLWRILGTFPHALHFTPPAYCVLRTENVLVCCWPIR